MAAALGYHAADPSRGPCLCFYLKPGSYDTTALIEVLEQVKLFYGGERARGAGLGRTVRPLEPGHARLGHRTGLADGGNRSDSRAWPEVRRAGHYGHARLLNRITFSQPEAGLEVRVHASTR